MLCVVLALSLVGCGTPSPDSVVKKFLLALQQGDLEIAGQYLEANTSNDFAEDITNVEPEDEEMQKALFSKLQYEIISSNIEGDNAKVKTKITSLDLVKITSSVMAEIMPLAFASAFSEDSNDEKLNELTEHYFNSAVLDPEAPTTTKIVTITLNKNEGAWIIVPDDELMNGVIGNISILEDLFN